MGFLTKKDVLKIQRDARKFMVSEQTATVSLVWSSSQPGNYDPLFHQYDSTPRKDRLDGVKAEKVIVTAPMIKRLGFATVKVGETLFRFLPEIELEKPDLEIHHNGIIYYPMLLNIQEQDILDTTLGDYGILKNIVVHKCKSIVCE